jgi:hypothetical protein
MRQFGIEQLIPPLHPNFSDELHNIHHEPRSQITWDVKHTDYVELWMARMQSIVSHDKLWDVRTSHNYMAWFNREGMRTVWWRSSTAANIHNHPPSASGSRLHLSFSMNSETVQQTVNYYLPFYFVSSFMI